MTTAINITDLRFEHPSPEAKPLPTIGGVTVSIMEGERVCICGPSGCGKTTLLQLIGGLLTPTDGLIEVNTPWRESGAVVPCTILFQELNLFYWQRAIENIELALRARGVIRRDRSVEASKLLAQVGLSGFADYYPHELSGGMRQRLAIARALATHAPLLLLDEPWSNLDPAAQTAIELDLLALCDEKRLTSILVTHDIPQAIRFADRIVVLTKRPAKIRSIYKVNLPRPRNGVRESAQFHELEDTLWQAMTTD